MLPWLEFVVTSGHDSLFDPCIDYFNHSKARGLLPRSASRDDSMLFLWLLHNFILMTLAVIILIIPRL